MRVDVDELTLRSAQSADAEILTEWWNDGAVMAHAGFPLGLGTTLERTRESIEQNDARSQLLMIEWLGQPIGECNYRIRDGCAEIGIKICRAEFQNQGIGKKVLRTLIRTLFEMRDDDGEFLIEKIVLDTNLKNTRAQHVYEQLGFRKLGVNVDSWQDQSGQWQTTVDYELERASYATRFQATML